MENTQGVSENNNMTRADNFPWFMNIL
jgi:hypothetical protein